MKTIIAISVIFFLCLGCKKDPAPPQKLYMFNITVSNCDSCNISYSNGEDVNVEIKGYNNPFFTIIDTVYVKGGNTLTLSAEEDASMKGQKSRFQVWARDVYTPIVNLTSIDGKKITQSWTAPK